MQIGINAEGVELVAADSVGKKLVLRYGKNRICFIRVKRICGSDDLCCACRDSCVISECYGSALSGTEFQFSDRIISAESLFIICPVELICTCCVCTECDLTLCIACFTTAEIICNFSVVFYVRGAVRIFTA